MRLALAIVAAFLAAVLIAAGCAGSPAAPKHGQPDAEPATQESTLPVANRQPAGQPPVPAAQENASPEANPQTFQPAPKQEYVNYCYPTYWRGSLEGRAHNNFSEDGCGDYDYAVKIDVIFTMPFDLAAYFNGTDFNFLDCPGVGKGARDGKGDISIGGSFTSLRTVTSAVKNSVDARPDTVSTSAGALYTSQRAGIMIAAYPKYDEKAALAGGKYPHLIANRCTLMNGFRTAGVDSAILYMNTAKAPTAGRIEGRWGVGSREMGGFALERTN